MRKLDIQYITRVNSLLYLCQLIWLVMSLLIYLKPLPKTLPSPVTTEEATADCLPNPEGVLSTSGTMSPAVIESANESVREARKAQANK
uniref:Uncharacterized protein n=1 Tax=Amphimedon queenslandica TaxID=400682 RepID=A0A1X7V6B5_AMPQE